MKWRPHTLELGRGANDKRHEHSRQIGKLAEHAEYCLLELHELGTEGLWTCYKDVKEFLFDFYPDMPWNLPGQAETMAIMMKDKRWPGIVDNIKKNCDGFDFQAEFVDVLKDIMNNHDFPGFDRKACEATDDDVRQFLGQ